MEIYCAVCEEYAQTRLTDGGEIYPHRPDLATLPFWICDKCQGYVGCHHKNESNPTQPLGHIVSKAMKKIRIQVHRKLDPLWKLGKFSRKFLYNELTSRMGWSYHTAKIRNVEEGERVLKVIDEIIEEGVDKVGTK